MALPCSRRTVLQLAPAAMLYALGVRRAVAAPLRAEVLEDLRQMNDLAVQLRRGAITPRDWQDQMAVLAAQVDTSELSRSLDIERLAATLELPRDRALVRELGFAPLDQALSDAKVHIRLFMLGHGRAIIPHGHDDMVSMHWLLHGALRARHYDRIERSPEHMLIRPTIDRVLRPGMATTVSDDRDNVHWFVAVEGPTFSLGVVVPRLTGEGPSGRVYLDPKAATEAGVPQRSIGVQEIVDRCVLALVNEGARILEEGYALRAGDIDIVYLYGYGFPSYRGGPMWYADTVGLKNVLERIRTFEERHGYWWRPAPLLSELAAAGKTFAEWDRARA